MVGALFLVRIVGTPARLADVEALVLFEGASLPSSTSSIRLFLPPAARPLFPVRIAISESIRESSPAGSNMEGCTGGVTGRGTPAPVGTVGGEVGRGRVGDMFGPERVGESGGVFGREQTGEIGGAFASDRAAADWAGVPARQGGGEGEGEASICGRESPPGTTALVGCWDCNAGVSIGGVVAFEEAEGSDVRFFEVCKTESKSAPADSRSIVARLSNPSSIGKARARHSSGAKLHTIIKYGTRQEVTQEDSQ